MGGRYVDPIMLIPWLIFEQQKYMNGKRSVWGPYRNDPIGYLMNRGFNVYGFRY